MGQAKGHQGLHPCFRFLGTGDRLGPDPPPDPRLVQSEGRAQARRHLPFRNPQGGTGGEGAALRDEHISRDLESRGLSHA